MTAEIDTLHFQLFSVHYLLNARAIERSNEWVSEKDLPGGATFFRGPHAIPTQLIAKRFGNATDQFERVCRQLQGVPLAMADAAFRFEISPRIPAAVLYWCGDDDFPAESKLLFDRTIKAHCALDIIFALAVGICH